MLEIKPISTDDQQRELEEKLDLRLNYQVLTDEAHKEAKENQVLAYDLCDDDWKFFVNNFIWIQDPEADNQDEKQIPFLLWNFQEQVGNEIVKAVEGQYDLPIEKCRKLGLTWLVEAILLWGWLFREWEVLVGSNKFENVDKKGDPGTLLQKIRFMIERLPQWLFPIKLNHYTDKVGMIIHPRHESTLAGEANNPFFGRSDRRKVIFLDEFTSWEQTDRAAYQSCQETTKCRLSVSTPNTRGTNCWFFTIIKDAKAKDKPYLTLPWHLRPDYAQGLRKATENDLAFRFGEQLTSPWLENKIKNSTDDQSIAQELLINYQASMAGKVFPDFDYEAQVVEGLEYDENLPLYVAWDFGLDATAMIWIQIDKGFIKIIDEYQNSASAVNSATDIYHYLEILESKDYKAAVHYGDPFSGERRDITSGTSSMSILRRHGVMFPKAERMNQKSSTQAGRNILKNVQISDKCILTVEMFSSWQMRRPKTGNTISEVPDHSGYSHIGKAFCYFAWNYNNRKVRIKNKTTKIFTPSPSGVM